MAKIYIDDALKKYHAMLADPAELKTLPTQKDYLGSTIKIGDRGIYINSWYSEFKKITVKAIKDQKSGTSIGFVSDGNEKIVWTYPARIIIQDSIKIKL